MESGVYILLNKTKSVEDKIYIKIGCSKNIEKRIKQIKSSFKFNGNLDELELLDSIKCKKYKELESTLHTCLKCYKITNEWFKVTEDKLNQRLMMIDISRYN